LALLNHLTFPVMRIVLLPYVDAVFSARR